MRKLFLLLLFSFMLVNVSAQEWIINGSEVYFDDERVYIASDAYSNTPEIRFKGKEFTGNVNIAFGFGTDKVTPTWAGYNPQIQNVTKSYTCDDYFNYTLSPNHFWCYRNVSWTNNQTSKLESKLYPVYNRSFDTGNLGAKTAYWNEEEEVWTNVSGAFKTVNYQIEDIDTWYYKENFGIIANNTYRLKLNLQQHQTGIHKYWIAFWPSTLTIGEARNQNKFYALDPWTSDLNTNLTDFFTFNESSGVQGYNSRNVSNNGTFNTAPSWVSGLIGNQANVTDDRMDIHPVRHGDFSISLWFEAYVGSVDDALFGNGDSSTVGGLYTFLRCSGTQKLHLYVRDGTGVTISNADWSEGDTVCNNGRHHVVYTYHEANDTWTVYLDGSPMTLSDSSGNWAQATTNMTIAGNAVGGYNSVSAGSVEELGIWNGTLSAAQVTALYNGGSGITYTLAAAASLTVTDAGPSDNEVQVNPLANFNATVTQGDYNITNVSLYIDGVLNQSNTSAFNGSYNFNGYFPIGTYNWSIVAADANNDYAASANRTINFTSLIEDSQTFTASVLTQSIQNYTLNISNHYEVTSALFIWNGTSYIASVADNGETSTISYTGLSIPTVTGQTTVNFTWNVTTNNSVTTEIPAQNQTIEVLKVDDCSSYSEVIYNFSVVDEQNQSAINNVSAELSLNFTAETTGEVVVSYSNSSSSNNFAVCANSSIVDPILVTGEVQYGAVWYATEFYNFVNDRVTDTAQHENITLYDLHNTSSTTFKLLYKDASFLPVEDALVQVTRKYISEGVFKTVEQPITDTDGETLVHLELENVIYTFNIIVGGNLDAVFSNVKASCPNPSLEPCEISLYSTGSNVDLRNFSNSNNVSFAFEFDRATRVVSTDFVIIDGSARAMNMTVLLFDNYGNDTVCTDTLSSSSGTLSCTVPTSYGNQTIIASLYDGDGFIGRAVISLMPDPSETYGANLVIMGLFMVLVIVGISASPNPVLSLAFLIVGSLLLIGLNLVYSTGMLGAASTVLWLIVCIVILMVKGANR